ncbi:hypothetical protein [Mycobacteroides abscessus]|uniref:hypothetical protein n=1 Tax=Mycobacteroides abscessus TaxID=36809 RepID=UPI000928772D|nr:hypothetical protein [Mycobacteroides abscessus]SIF35246.1 Protein of uncharacterised function (DUF2637) [Mycobacteroides abscessus subsp. abscessus]
MSTAERRYEILLAEEAERARARSVFQWGMIGGLALTLGGNLALPLVSPSVPLSLVAFSLPPLLAGWGAHMALTVHRAAPRTEAGKRAAKGAVALAALLFGIALVASYAHLRELFIRADYAGWLASIFAGAIDLALLSATYAWFAMRPASDAELRAARAEIEGEEAAELQAREDAERARLDAERASREARNAELERARLAHEAELERARLAAEAELERARMEAQERTRAAAQRVIERSRPSALMPELDHRFAAQAEAAHRARVAKRTPIEKVAAALELLSIGETNGGVERGCGVHRDTVQKLREWLAEGERAA